MAGVLSLQCGECGTLFKTVEGAEEHAEATKHTNFCESTEAVLNIVCSSCARPCRSKTAISLHRKRTGHTDFEEEKKKPDSKAEQRRECLLCLKQNHEDEDEKVRTAFTTLLTFVKNVVTNPNEEKYRRIRLSNPAIQERVGKLKGGVEFLQLCGFEKLEDVEFLFLRREKVDMAVLNTAGNQLNSAINNPYFGRL